METIEATLIIGNLTLIYFGVQIILMGIRELRKPEVDDA